MNLDDVRAMSARQLIDTMLATDDSETFWVLLGMLCAKKKTFAHRQIWRDLWATAYSGPSIGYLNAVRILKLLQNSPLEQIVGEAHEQH